MARARLPTMAAMAGTPALSAIPAEACSSESEVAARSPQMTGRMNVEMLRTKSELRARSYPAKSSRASDELPPTVMRNAAIAKTVPVITYPASTPTP